MDDGAHRDSVGSDWLTLKAVFRGRSLDLRNNRPELASVGSGDLLHLLDNHPHFAQAVFKTLLYDLLFSCSKSVECHDFHPKEVHFLLNDLAFEDPWQID